MAISRKLLNEGEDIIISTRTHPKALILPVLVLVVLAGIAGYLTSITSSGVAHLITWIVAGLLIAWFTAWPFLNWLTATYTITNRRLITRNGILTRKGHDIPLNRISDVSYERGVVDRMLGCGTLIISDASERGQVELPDVPKVEQTQLKLSGLLYDQHNPRHDDGS